MYRRLYEALGPQNWWPAETPLETIVGAILTQNTAWSNVSRAIENLRRAGCLDWQRLRDLSLPALERLIRPSGTYRVKARRLKAFVGFLFERYGGDLERMFATPLPELREQLLAVPGIGRETADAILLYAGHLPTFVVDAYTARILRRHHLIDEEADYEQIKALFEENLPADVRLFNEYHALLVEAGKRYCRPKARCEACPLNEMPHDADLR